MVTWTSASRWGILTPGRQGKKPGGQGPTIQESEGASDHNAGGSSMTTAIVFPWAPRLRPASVSTSDHPKSTTPVTSSEKPPETPPKPAQLPIPAARRRLIWLRTMLEREIYEFGRGPQSRCRTSRTANRRRRRGWSSSSSHQSPKPHRPPGSAAHDRRDPRGRRPPFRRASEVAYRAPRPPTACPDRGAGARRRPSSAPPTPRPRKPWRPPPAQGGAPSRRSGTSA